MSYLLLPGDRPRKYRLALARRIVDESMPQRAVRNPAKAYVQVRTRVLSRSMRPRWRLRVGLGRWLSALPAVLPPNAQTAPLAALTPEVRAAYVLRTVEKLPYYAVHDQLVVLGVRDARAVLCEAAEIAEPEEPVAELPVVPGRRRRPMTPVVVASLLTLVLIAGIVVTENGQRARRRTTADGVGAAGPQVWRHAAHALAVWPARGDLVSDRALVAAASAAWRRGAAVRTHDGAAAGPPHRRTQLLYAGRIGGDLVTMLSDGQRIARYARAAGLTDVFPAPAAGTAPLVLGEGRYLLPPWVSAVRASAPGRPWRPVTVQDGVAAASPDLARNTAECAGGPVLALAQPEGERTVADLGGPALADVSLPPRPPVCALPAPGRAVTAARVTELWSGRLPGGGSGRWLCARYTFPDGSTGSHATLYDGGDRHPAGDCGALRAGDVSGLWWRPGHGRWYYLAAASSGLRPYATGKFRDTGREHGLLVAVGPKGAGRPRVPVVLTARAH